jgi:hypothetical protein
MNQLDVMPVELRMGHLELNSQMYSRTSKTLTACKTFVRGDANTFIHEEEEDIMRRWYRWGKEQRFNAIEKSPSFLSSFILSLERFS